MKMMISTNSTSINGTMLGSETGPRLPPPTGMPMIRTPFRMRRYVNLGSTAQATGVQLYSPDFFDTAAHGFVPQG
jgi:hypothetical protein